MKRLTVILILLLALAGMLSGCSPMQPQIAATTLPVYEFTTLLCAGTGITTGRVVTENVSCLHDYTLQVSQMRMLESADLVVISGAGLEGFLDGALEGSANIIDASTGTHSHESGHHHDGHEEDPHIWLSPENAKIMVANICAGLTQAYPQHEAVFSENLTGLLSRLDDVLAYGQQTLSSLPTRSLVTFHDGFSCFAEAFGLTVLRAVEEESGSEASAAELKELCMLVSEHDLPAVFTERNGSTSAAEIISAETGAQVYALDMAMSGSSYFDAMYHNIDTVKEALG